MSSVSLVLLLGCLSPFANAASLYISPLGRDDGDCASERSACKTLQYAAKQAEDLDHINVLTGVYTGTDNFIDLSSSTYANNLSIAAYPFTTTPSKYVFDAQAETRRLSLGVGNSIRGIEFRGSSSTSYGVVYLKENALISDCTFVDNNRAISIYYSAYDVVISNVNIDLACESAACTTPGYAIYFDSNTNSLKATARIVGVTIKGVDKKGYGIYMNGGTVSVEGLDATDLAYAIRAGTSSTSSSTYHLTVDNAHFNYNMHGIYAYGKTTTTTSDVKISNSKFDHNGCESCNGPAFFLGEHITGVVESTTFTGGNASKTGKGAAFFCDKATTLNMRGVSFTSNVAYDSSPGWCDKNCGFFADKIINIGSSSEVETGHCRGL